MYPIGIFWALKNEIRLGRFTLIKQDLQKRP